MGHGKGHFGPIPLLAPSSIHFPCQPLPTRYFSVISPPFKDPYKKTHFLTQSPSFGASQPYLWPHPTPPSKTLATKPHLSPPICPIYGPICLPLQRPLQKIYFLTPHTFPLQRLLQITLFFKLVYDEESVFFPFYRAAGYNSY